LKLLNQEKNASDRALQTAEATAQRDQILVQSVRTRLALAWGKNVAERADLAAFVQSLASSENALLRLDLPAGEVLTEYPSDARIVIASAEEKPAMAHLLGPAANADLEMQGQGFLFFVKARSPRLVPGTAVTGYLQMPQEPLKGFIIPDSAVVRENGHGWVYAQTGADTFTRRKISLDHPTENGWFVRDAVSANDRVVVSGAQALLSEEQKYQIRMLE
jgi:hypothetical protein